MARLRLRERFAAFLRPDEGKAYPVWPVVYDEIKPEADEGGGVPPIGQDLTKFLRTVGLFPWLTAGIRANCTTAASVPLKVGRQRGESVETFESHPLLDLFERPHGETDGEGYTSFYWGLVQQLEFFGEVFVADEKADGELWIMPAPRVTIVPGPSNSEPVLAYRYRGPTRSVTIPAGDVIHIKYPNPLSGDSTPDALHGLSKLKELESTLRVMFSSREWTTYLYANGVRLSGVLQIPGELSPTAYKRLQESFRKGFQGVRNFFKPLIAEGGATWKESGAGPKDAQTLETWKLAREEILAVIGTPPIVVGLIEGANYANAREQRRAHFTNTIVPLNALITDAFNASPVVRRLGEGFYLFHDYSGVEALQKDKKLQADVDAIYLDRGVVTPNEIRLRDELGEPLEGGDEPIRSGIGAPLGFVPPAPNGDGGNGDEPTPPEDNADEETEPAEDEEKARPEYVVAYVEGRRGEAELSEYCKANGFASDAIYDVASGSGLLVSPQAPMRAGVIRDRGGFRAGRLWFAELDAEKVYDAFELGTDYESGGDAEHKARGRTWVRQERRRQPEERRWRRKLSELFEREERDLLGILERFEQAGRSFANGNGAETKAEIPPDILARLIEGATLADEWYDDLIALAEKTYGVGARGAGADLALAGLGTRVLPDVAGDAVQVFLQEWVATKITSIEANQRETLRALVARGFAEGETIAELTKRLRSTFDGMRRWKALQIARTETVGLTNAGALGTLKESGAATKVWVTARDADVRDSHASMEGVEVGLDENFYVGSGSGPHPGSIGVAKEDINCRCGVVLGQLVAETQTTGVTS